MTIDTTKLREQAMNQLLELKMEETLKQVLMRRDGMSSSDADDAIEEARERVFAGEDPEEILLEDFGLEPDYIFDLLGG